VNEYIGYVFTIIVSIITAATGYYFIRRKIDAETREKNSLSGKADAETLRLYQEMFNTEASNTKKLGLRIDELMSCQDNLESKLIALESEIRVLKDENISLRRRLKITESDNDALRMKLSELEENQK
jgi:predicted RNase H-like nuclease (RuvC/YqgF family)